MASEELSRNPGSAPLSGGLASKKPRLDSSGLAKLKEKFSFLREYSDSFIDQAGLEILIKAESVSNKLCDRDRSRKAEDKLLSNRDNLKASWVDGGEDNRLDIIHKARFLPGAVCSAQKLWLTARDFVGAKGPAPLSSYDMGSIGLGGSVSAKGWVEIHDPSSTSLSIRQFNLSGVSKVSSSSKDPDFPELEDLSELKNAIRALRGAMVFVHPWNRSIDALESFLIQSSFCSSDLAGIDKQAQLLSRFVDYVLLENANRFRDREPFLSTRDLRNTWSDFFSCRSGSLISRQKPAVQSKVSKQFHTAKQLPASGSLPSERYNVAPYLFNDDICVLWNLGKCIKAPGTCTNKKGTPLRHVCNFRPDPSKLDTACGKPHPAFTFHK